MRKLLLLLMIALLAVVLAPLAAQDAQTLVFGHIANPATLNPLLRTGTSENLPVQMLFDDLLETDSETGLPTPGLAESWAFSEDGLTITYKLREDAFWSDGTPITSADAKFTYDAYLSDLAPTSVSISNEVQEVNIIDDKTFEVVLNEVNCAFFNNFSPVLVPAHMYAPDFSDIADNPESTAPTVVSGPYMLDEWVADEFLRFTANPNYWRGEPHIKTIVFRIIVEPAVLNQSLQAGETDMGWMFADQLEQFSNTDNLNISINPSVGMLRLDMNWADPTNPQPAYDADGNPIEQDPHPIFGDVRVRQAVAMGWNKADLIESLGGSELAGTQVASTIPPFSWAYDPSIEPWPYDPAAAAALLDEAGWIDEDGDGIRECHGCLYAEEGTPLSFRLNSSGFIPSYQQAALVAQDQLSQLGMDVNLEIMEWGVFVELLLSQEYDMMVWGGGPFGSDPSGWADTFHVSTEDKPGGGGFNIMSYVNPELDRLSAEAKSVPGCAVEDRKPYYSEIARITHDDVVMDYILVSNSAFVVNKRVNVPQPFTYGNTLNDNFFPNIEQWTLNP